MSKENTPNYYAVIPANVRYDKDLTPNAKLLYAEITCLCNQTGYCWSTNKYFAELYNVSNVSISKWINQLVNKGYINSTFEYKEGTKEIFKRYLSLVNDPIKEKFNTPHKEKLKGNNTSNNIIIEEEPLDLPEVPSDVPSNLKLSQVNETTNVKNSKYYKITLGFRDLFLYNCKEFGIKNTKHLTDPDYIKFSNPIRLIIESDGYNIEDLRTVYDYLKNSKNTFWKKQVYSTSGLKEKFNKLIADAHAEQKQAVKTIKKPTLNI